MAEVGVARQIFQEILMLIVQLRTPPGWTLKGLWLERRRPTMGEVRLVKPNNGLQRRRARQPMAFLPGQSFGGESCCHGGSEDGRNRAAILGNWEMSAKICKLTPNTKGLLRFEPWEIVGGAGGIIFGPSPPPPIVIQLQPLPAR